MFSYTYKRQGVTMLSKNEIVKRYTNFKNKSKVFVAYHDEKPIASVLLYYTPSTCYFSKSISKSSRNSFSVKPSLSNPPTFITK